MGECNIGVQGCCGTRGVNSQWPDQPLIFPFTKSVMGTSLLFSFHYKTNLFAILPHSSRITAYLLCVAVAGGDGGVGPWVPLLLGTELSEGVNNLFLRYKLGVMSM